MAEKTKTISVMITGHKKVMCTALILKSDLNAGQIGEQNKYDNNWNRPEEKNSEAEEHRRLNCWRDWHSSKTFGQPEGLECMNGYLVGCILLCVQPVSDVWHLLLILVHITAEDDKSKALEQQRSLLLLQLFA